MILLLPNPVLLPNPLLLLCADGSYFLYFVSGGADPALPRQFDFWLTFRGNDPVEMVLFTSTNSHG